MYDLSETLVNKNCILKTVNKTSYHYLKTSLKAFALIIFKPLWKPLLSFMLLKTLLSKQSHWTTYCSNYNINDSIGYVVAQHRQKNALVSCYHRDICIGDWSTRRLQRSGVVQGIVVAMGTLLRGGVWLQLQHTHKLLHPLTHAHSPRRGVESVQDARLPYMALFWWLTNIRTSTSKCVEVHCSWYRISNRCNSFTLDSIMSSLCLHWHCVNISLSSYCIQTVQGYTTLSALRCGLSVKRCGRATITTNLILLKPKLLSESWVF